MSGVWEWHKATICFVALWLRSCGLVIAQFFKESNRCSELAYQIMVIRGEFTSVFERSELLDQ